MAKTICGACTSRFAGHIQASEGTFFPGKHGLMAALLFSSRSVDIMLEVAGVFCG